MSPEVAERSFEEAIECALLENGPDACAGDSMVAHETLAAHGDGAVPGGYRRRRPEDYDRGLCLLPRDVVDFLLATQPKEWENLRQHYGAEVKELADDRSVLGIEHDRLENGDKFMLHLIQTVRNGLGDRAGTCVDPRMQVVQGKTVCLVSCQRSPEPVFLKGNSAEGNPAGDFYVRSGPRTDRLSPQSADKYIRTRFGSPQAEGADPQL